MMDRLESERILLRPITADDTADILRWRNAPHVMEHFIIRTPLTEQQHLNWLKEQVGKGYVEQFIIVVRESGRAIGSQYFHHIDREKKTAEFGIFIGEPDALGKGYGPEVLDLALRHAREKMGLKTVTLRVIADNEVACKLYSGRGFKLIPESTQTREYNGREEKIYHMELVF
ncbi:MAG: GNAT family N-acetyltransferase [Lachnospiraceae bacterium]|nr:GNAT family N-acetyltransferase [Lachnospiraceae bacterium]